jgi:predicted Ser/Thr protein kinase
MDKLHPQSKFLILNKYQIDYTTMLGKGAMAKVYLGYYRSGDYDSNAMFAVK